VSITLTTGKLVVINGVTQENDTIGACVSMHIDYLANTAVFTFQIGQLVAGNINIGAYSTPITLTVNLATGAWTNSAGQSGTIGAGALASFVNQVKADRNAIESFAAGASAILPGLQVVWP